MGEKERWASAGAGLVSPEAATPLRADARRNRELILAAADEMFAAEGVGVPVDEIARRAGVGAGTLYRHFPTKEALFEAVLIAHMERLAARGRELAERDDPGVALFEFIESLAHEGASKKNLVDALSGAGIDFKASASASKAAVEGAFRELLLRAQKAGTIRTDVTVADLFTLVMGTCTLANPVAEGSQARMLAVVCAGLRVPG